MQSITTVNWNGDDETRSANHLPSVLKTPTTTFWISYSATTNCLDSAAHTGVLDRPVQIRPNRILGIISDADRAQWPQGLALGPVLFRCTLLTWLCWPGPSSVPTSLPHTNTVFADRLRHWICRTPSQTVLMMPQGGCAQTTTLPRSHPLSLSPLCIGTDEVIPAAVVHDPLTFLFFTLYQQRFAYCAIKLCTTTTNVSVCIHRLWRLSDVVRHEDRYNAHAV